MTTSATEGTAMPDQPAILQQNLQLRIDVCQVRKQLRLLAVALLALIAGVCVSLAGLLAMYFQRGDARQYYNERISHLVCAVPPRSDLIRQWRQDYHCGPYLPPLPTNPAPAPASASALAAVAPGGPHPCKTDIPLAKS